MFCIIVVLLCGYARAVASRKRIVGDSPVLLMIFAGSQAGEIHGKV